MEQLTETLGLYPLIHLPADLSVHYPLSRSLIFFPEVSLAFGRLLRAPPLLRHALQPNFVVRFPAVRPLPHVALLEIADVNPLAACVRLHVRVLVLPTFSDVRNIKTTVKNFARDKFSRTCCRFISRMEVSWRCIYIYIVYIEFVESFWIYILFFLFSIYILRNKYSIHRCIIWTSNKKIIGSNF